jgi:hypothetical protein
MQDDALTADSVITEKQQAIKDSAITIARLKKAISDYIQGDFNKAGQGADCPIKSVAIDTTSETINVGLNQPAQDNIGGGTDMAMSAIGRILERSLRNSAYTWNSAVFTVYFDYNGNKAVEFQATYARSAVDAANFAMTIDRGNYLDDQGLVNLAQDFWLSPVINTAQANPVGMAATPDVQYAMPSVSTPYYTNDVWYDVLIIGGYRRHDGSYCAPVYVKRPHRDKDSHDPRLHYPPLPPPSASPPHSPTMTPVQSGTQNRATPTPNQPQKPATPPKNTAPPPQPPPVVKPG